MSYTLFKPNKNNKGALLNINFSAKADTETEKGDKSFYFKLVGQTSWDASKNVGSFKDGPYIITKMAPHEVAGIIYAIRNNIALNEAMNTEYVYHDGEDSATIISFSPYFKKTKVEDENGDEKWVDTDRQVGFALRITKKSKSNTDEKVTLGLGFNFAESELLIKYLDDGLTHICDAWFSDDINRAKAKRGEQTDKSSKKRTSRKSEDKKEIETKAPSEVDTSDVVL